jgi:hypothetical protein
MSLYMLDTDTCAFILRRSSPALLARIQAVPGCRGRVDAAPDGS